MTHRRRCGRHERRLDPEGIIQVLEKTQVISYAQFSLPYLVGGVVDSSEKLSARSPEAFREKIRIAIHLGYEALSINPHAHEVVARDPKRRARTPSPATSSSPAPSASSLPGPADISRGSSPSRPRPMTKSPDTGWRWRRWSSSGEGTSGVPFGDVTFRSFSHIRYDPGGKERQLLGSQIKGEEGAVKRIDVPATALYQGLTLDDLQVLDLAYSPPYKSVWDALQQAVSVARKDLQ